MVEVPHRLLAAAVVPRQAEVPRQLLAAVVVPRQAEVPRRLLAAAVVHQLAEVPHRLLAAVVVPRQAEVPRRLLPAAVVHQLVEVSHRLLLAADVAGPLPPVEAAVLHPMLVALERAPEELVVAATRTEMLMAAGSISKWVGLPLAGATTEESGTGRNGTSGAVGGTNTASAGAGSKPRSVLFGFAAERVKGAVALNHRRRRGD